MLSSFIVFQECMMMIMMMMMMMYKAQGYTYGTCGLNGSTPSGISFFDDANCNSTHCVAECMDGYYPEGGELNCVNHTWTSSDAVHCEAQCASNLTGIFNFIDPTSLCAQNETNSTCLFNCISGYSPLGPATCISGTWYNATCAMDCDPHIPPAIEHIADWNTTSCGNISVPSTNSCSYSCQPNYSPYPTGYTQCMNGTFNENNKENCLLDCAGNPPITNIDDTLTNCTGTRSGASCFVTCLPGYYSPYASICYNNSWELMDENGSYIFFPQYCNKDCFSNPTISNLNESVTNCTGTRSTEFCNIQCDDGYDPKPSNNAYCLDDSWESDTSNYPVPSCELRCYDDVPKLVNMDYNRTNSSCVGLQSRETCSDFSCQSSGYDLEGSLSCLNGTWSFSSDASCTPSSCTNVPSGLNVDTAAMLSCLNSPHNSTCKVKCLLGFISEGDSNVTCEFGNWIGTVSCEETTTTQASTTTTTQATTTTTTSAPIVSLPCVNFPVENSEETSCQDNIQSCDWTCLDGFAKSSSSGTTIISCNNGTWEGDILNVKCSESEASEVASAMAVQLSTGVVAISSVAIVSSFVASLSVYSSLALSTTALNIAMIELLLSTRALSLIGTMQGMSETQHSMARHFLYVNGMIPPPKLSEDWDWYSTDYDLPSSSSSSSNVTRRRRQLDTEDTTTSSRVTLDLTYTISGLIVMLALLWIVRGSIRIAIENLCCCCDASGGDVLHYLELADDFMLFPQPELCMLMLIFTALTKNVMAPFTLSDDVTEHTIASLLFVFIIIPSLLCVIVVGFSASHRLSIEEDMRRYARTSNVSRNHKKKKKKKKRAIDLCQPYLHIENDIYWVDKSLDDKHETEYVKRFGPIFYDFTLNSVKNLVPVFLFISYFVEGMFFGLVDYHTPSTSIILIIVMYVIELLLFSLSCPLLLHSDNIWKVARIVVVIVILFLAMARREESDGDVQEEYDLAMLILWIFLILLSIARVIFNYFDLIKHGLFSCCGSCCPQRKGKKRFRTSSSTSQQQHDDDDDENTSKVYRHARKVAHGGFGGGLVDVAGTMIFGGLNHVMRKRYEREVEKKKQKKQEGIELLNTTPTVILEKPLSAEFASEASEMRNVTSL